MKRIISFVVIFVIFLVNASVLFAIEVSSEGIFSEVQNVIKYKKNEVRCIVRAPMGR